MHAKMRFDFEKENGDLRHMTFQNPVAVFTTNKLEEVLPTLENVSAAVDSGYYVAGYLSYEAAPAFEEQARVNETPNLPLIWFASFEEPVKNESADPNASYTLGEWKIDTSLEKYTETIKQIKEAIRIGDTYQVNYTTRLKAPFSGRGECLYESLLTQQNGKYSCYLDTGAHEIISLSPELFFEVSGNKITTKPMKGTMKRGKTIEEDHNNKSKLFYSEKERAENLMIVDLLRNDLGRIAKKGTVEVTKPLAIETYPTVHQMTSTIEADLKDNLSIIDWFKALFPCGSITGAPKLKTMRYIQALESSARDVYCGTLGFITPDREAVFNVPIRTIIVNPEKEEATYGVGGGITWDSSVDGEYDEIWTKAKVLSEHTEPFELLESIRLENGGYPLLGRHLKRLQGSASYFDYPFNEEHLKKALIDLAYKQPQGVFKVRLLLNRTGEIDIAANAFMINKEPVTSYLATEPIDAADPFLYHKTTKRSIYTDRERKEEDNFSTLLFNEAGELTEFTIGNLVLQIDGIFYTPPVDAGLLAGVYREELIEKNKIQVRKLMLSDLKQAESIALLNGVRGWVKVKEVKGL